jgi:hypothetical protein
MHWKKVVYLVAREASNFYYSRLKVSADQLAAKAEFVYLLRESRHMGIALGLDSVRSFSIDIDVRSLADFTVLKACGVQGLSRDLKWLYSYVDPPLLRKLAPDCFMLVTKKGCIGYGKFDEIAWHKQEREDIVNAVGISIEYGEVLEQPLNRGTYKTVGDGEHAQILQLYAGENLSMSEIADRLARSPRTINLHINGHNLAVKKAGTCPSCKRAQSDLACREVGHGGLPLTVR